MALGFSYSALSFLQQTVTSELLFIVMHLCGLCSILHAFTTLATLGLAWGSYLEVVPDLMEIVKVSFERGHMTGDIWETDPQEHPF